MGYKSPNLVTINAQQGSTAAPVVLTTYYFGSEARAWVVGADVSRIYIPKPGVIRTVLVSLYTQSRDGSNEAWELFLRLNNTTDYSLGSVSAAASNRVWLATLNVSVYAGDYFEVKTTTPNWSLTPLGVWSRVVVVLEVGG